MGTATLISVEEYLASTYRPDRELVAGVLLERNLGEWDHSLLQTSLSHWLYGNRVRFRIQVLVELRVQLRTDRFRVPDICVVADESPKEQILTHPPLICIEILSKSDTMQEMQDRIDDYLGFGVPEVWVLNPRNAKAWIYTRDGAHEVKEPILRSIDGRVEVPLAEIFGE
jgi:Uma2 family endonuclease